MASSLGASFGVAISAAIFTALSASGEGVNWLAGVVTFVGRQDNVAVREAAMFAFGANLLMVVAAIIAIVLLVPSGKMREEAAETEAAHSQMTTPPSSRSA
jgi:DHA2 family multidrug resistance protein-like MFS transporter